MTSRRGFLQAGLGAVGTAVWPLSGVVLARVGSPNRRIEVVTWLGRHQALGLTVVRDGVVLLCARLGLDVADGCLSQGLRLTGSASAPADDSYALVCGKTRQVHAAGHERVLQLQAPSGRAVALVMRAYDDGVAFRYRLPDGGDLRAELTRFDFPRDYRCWGADLGGFDTAHETVFQEFRASQLPAHSLLDAPLVCLGPAGLAFAIAEADLQDYAALCLARPADGRLGVEVRLAPIPDDPAFAVRWPSGAPHQTPWRVIMIGDQPGRLIESNLITTLSQPAAFADTGWVRPGKAAWDWWSGAALDGVRGPRMGNATMMRLIDFAAATHLQFLLIDAGWYAYADPVVAGDPADITRPIPAIDLAMLVGYAGRRGIGVFVWLHWRHLDAQLEAGLDYLRRIGVTGIKVDFMNRDDQEMMAFYHRVLSSAAAREIMVDLHGATHPAGLQRTYPNLVTQEAVMGAEYNKWTDRVTSRHNVTLPFTRMLLGPMDYTPGGFRNVTPERFVARDVLPLVQTTRGQALAMYVVYDSPFACVADSPDTYRDAAGLDFIAAVPTSWDEVRVLSGEIGAYIALARRAGVAWFVGVMTAGRPRTLSIPLDFLGESGFTATIYADGAAPDQLTTERGRPVARGARIDLALAPHGGGVIVIRPV